MKKIMTWTAVGLVVVIGLLAIIPFAVDLNKYHDAILKRLKPYVNRQVDFTTVRLTILSGLGAELRGLTVLDDPAYADDSFLTVDTVQLKVALLPLLKKKIMVRAVVLKKPQVNVIRGADGTFNFQHLLVPQPEKEKGKPSIASTLLIRLVEIKDGRFSYLDLKPGVKRRPFVIDAIDLKAHEVSLFRPIALDLKAAVMTPKDQNLLVHGTVGPLNLEAAKSSPLTLTASLKDLPLSALPVQTPWPSGKADFKLDASGSLADTIDIKADLNLAGIGAAPHAPREALNCVLTTLMQLDYPQESLRIENGAIDLGGARGSFSGGVEKLRNQPTWNMGVRFARLDPEVLTAALPMLAKRLPPALAFKGPAGLTVVSTGTAGAFEIKTEADLSTMGIVYGKTFTKPGGIPLTIKNTAGFQKGLIDIPSLEIGLDQMTTTVTGQIRTDQDKTRYRFLMQSDNLGLEKAARLVPSLAAFKPAGTLRVRGELSGGDTPLTLFMRAASKALVVTLSKSQTQATHTRMLSGPMRAQLGDVDLEFTARKPAQGLKALGNLNSRQGTLMNIPYRNLRSTFGYESDRLAVQRFAFDVFKGAVSGSAAYHLTRRRWEAEPRIVNVQAGSILDIFSPASGVFSGTLTGAGRASGSAGQGPALASLSAASDIRLSQGEWRNFDLSKTALGSLLAIPGFSQIVGISEQDVQAYRTTRFDSLAAKLTIERGTLAITDLAMTGIRSGGDQDATARLNGTLNLSTRALALKGSFGLPKRLSQRLVKKNKAMQNLTDETQRVTLPLKVGGTLQKPSPAVDTRTIQKALAGYYADQAVEKGLEKIQKKTGAGKEVEQLLKGILNR